MNEHEWQGTRDISAYLAVSAAIEFWKDHNWPKVIAQCQALLGEARQALNALGLQPVADRPELSAPQMAAFLFPHCDRKAVQKTLWTRFGVEVPLIPWNHRVLLRVSIQGYNTWADVERLVHALQEVLPTLGG